MDEADDRTIWAYAKTYDFAAVSKDEGFFHFAVLDSTGPTLVWVRMGNCRKAVLFEAFKAILPKLLEAVQTGQRIIELR